jgi:hypothetical protein
MVVDVLAWAPDKKTWEQAITTTIVASTGQPLATYAYGEDGRQIMPPQLLPHDGLSIDEIGEIYDPSVSPPGTPPEDMVPPTLAAPGWHVNLLFQTPLAEILTEGLPQTGMGPIDPEVGRARMVFLPLFERTHFLTLFPDAVWQEDASGVPGGYMGTKGLKLFDPASVKSRTRIWA